MLTCNIAQTNEATTSRHAVNIKTKSAERQIHKFDAAKDKNT